MRGRSKKTGCTHGSATLTFGLPSKRNNIVLILQCIDGDVLLPDSEELEVGRPRLFGLGEPICLDAQVIALVLPVHLDVGNTEQVLLTFLDA